MPDIVHDATDEDPSVALVWIDRNGNVVDLSTATITAKLIHMTTGAVVHTITGTVTGAATSPNVTISPAIGEFAALDGIYKLKVQATIAGRARTFRKGRLPTWQITPND